MTKTHFRSTLALAAALAAAISFKVQLPASSPSKRTTDTSSNSCLAEGRREARPSGLPVDRSSSSWAATTPLPFAFQPQRCLV